MSLPVSRIQYLLGDGLHMDFGVISDFEWLNEKGNIESIKRGEYSLSVFDCFWGIKRYQDEEFLVQSAMLESYEDGLKYLELKDPLYIYTIRKYDDFHWSIIMTDGFVLFMELKEISYEGNPFLFMNHDECPILFDVFFKNVFYHDFKSKKKYV